MLASLIRELANDLKLIPGVGSVLESPPEQANGPWPMIVLYPDSGIHRLSTTRNHHGMPGYESVHTISIRLMVPRKDLGWDMALLLPIADRVPEAILAGYVRDRFNGLALSIGDARSPGSGSLRYEFGPDGWGALDTLAFRWSLDITTEDVVEESI
jgi:hypothetical protein